MKYLLLIFFIFIGVPLVAQTNRINDYDGNDVNLYLYNYQTISDEIISSAAEDGDEESLLLYNYLEKLESLINLIGAFFLNDRIVNENNVIEYFESLLHEDVPGKLKDIFKKYNRLVQ
jgi:hypothetical protein